MTNKKLLALRKQIDRVDYLLLKILKRRFGLTQKVGELKVRYNLPVRDLKREEEKLLSIMQRWSLDSPDGKFIRKLFLSIMSEARKNHKKLKKILK
jgi:chorismate mutase